MNRVANFLSSDDCKFIVEKGLDSKIEKIISHSVKPYSNEVNGFLGQHFLLKITYKHQKEVKFQQYFMKILNGDSKVIFDISMSINAYAKEEFYYTLLNEYKKYNIDTSFAPKSYFFKPYLIVIEDLSLKHFTGARVEFFTDFHHCKAALGTLAKFHSSSIIYENVKSKENGDTYSLFETHPNMLEEIIFCRKPSVGKDWFKCSVGGVFKLINIVPENHITKEAFAEKLSDFLNRAETVVEGFSKYRSAILHGDVWLNNFLFRFQNDKPTESVLIDYQLLKYGPPIVDVMNVFYSNTRKKFRDKYFEELIDYYYNCLRDCLVKRGIEDLTKSMFIELNNDLLIVVKLLCLCDRCVTLKFDDFNDIIYTDDESFHRYLFEDRAKNIEIAFNKGGMFREVIEEDILELREMLFGES